MGEVRRFWFEGPAGRLEGMLRAAADPSAAAVVAHPHPLHGGTLHNPVVFHAERELHRLGWTTLRFNFRGVGASDGVHDQGLGEVEDLAAAVAWIRGLAPGKPLCLVGYSFGSLCGLRYLERRRHGVDRFTAIGLPVREYDLGDVAALDLPIGVVQGTMDEFGSPGEVREALKAARHPVKLLTVADATHLFPGKVQEAASAVVETCRTLGS